MILASARSSVAVTDDALSKLADVAAVRPEMEVQFADDIRARVRDSWFRWHLIDSGQDPGSRFGPILEPAMIALEASFARLVTAAREVRSSVAGLAQAGDDVCNEATDHAELEKRRQFLDKYAADLATPSPTTIDAQCEPTTVRRSNVLELLDHKVLTFVLYLADQARTAPMFPTLLRGRGRPVSLVTDSRRILIHELLDDVDKAGGKLTFNKNRVTSGTRALCILAPFVPEGLIPKALPLRTLAGNFKEWKALKKRGGQKSER
jgi:hypothetical protein